MKFEMHTIASAPAASRPELEATQQAFGTVFNLYRGLATNPATLKIYMAFKGFLDEHGVLTPVEQQVVYLTVSAENGCTYCVGAHSVLAGMAKMPPQVLDELRAESDLSDPRLDALRRFTLAVMRHRGWVPEVELAAFTAAGYDQRHVLEVITILAQKTISNYFNHLAQTPLDQIFAAQQWTRKREPV